jgi:hypothetical protein
MKTMPQLTPEELARNRAVFAAAVEARVGIPYSLYEELPAEGQRALEDLARQRAAIARSKTNPKPKSTGKRGAKPKFATDEERKAAASESARKHREANRTAINAAQRAKRAADKTKIVPGENS